MKYVPREGMRKLMCKNTSHTLTIILICIMYFVHILDITILLQFLVMIDQTGIHNQHRSYT